MTPFPEGSDGWRLREELLERRIVLLNGPLDDVTAGTIAAELMTLDAAGDEPVRLQIDSAGGTLEAALAVIDVVDLLGVPVHATCVGKAEGAGLAVLAVADRRVAGRHARLRLCEPLAEHCGDASELARWAEQRRRQVGQLCGRLATATGRPATTVAEWLRQAAYLTPQQALERGLIDEVATPTAEVHHLPRRVGFRLR